MGVNIEEEWRLKRRSSEAASKPAFTFKVNSKLKQAKTDYGYGVTTPYSREVVVKITGGALSKKGLAVLERDRRWELARKSSKNQRYLLSFVVRV